MRQLLFGFTGLALLSACAPTKIDGTQHAQNTVVEATIASVQADILLGKMKCSDVVEAYIARIEAYDQSTSLNAITYKTMRRLGPKQVWSMRLWQTGAACPHCFVCPCWSRTIWTLRASRPRQAPKCSWIICRLMMPI